MTSDTFTLLVFWSVIIIPCLLLLAALWQHQRWITRKEAQRKIVEERAQKSLQEYLLAQRLALQAKPEEKNVKHDATVDYARRIQNENLRRQNRNRGNAQLQASVSRNRRETDAGFDNTSAFVSLQTVELDPYLGLFTGGGGGFSGAGASSSWTPVESNSYSSSCSSSSSDSSSSSSSSDSGSSSCGSSD